MTISVLIQNEPERNRWAYSVRIDTGLFAIGYGITYKDTQRIASRMVRKAEKWILKNEPKI